MRRRGKYGRLRVADRLNIADPVDPGGELRVAGRTGSLGR